MLILLVLYENPKLVLSAPNWWDKPIFNILSKRLEDVRSGIYS